ncbi:hypothetical protein [Streptomyces sp. NPDC057253]|uniref:hypothetical protein n=1 Tax=Streptomyces sp. NPDC057253 TaxID=3346069 RepID=UPI00362E480A
MSGSLGSRGELGPWLGGSASSAYAWSKGEGVARAWTRPAEEAVGLASSTRAGGAQAWS